MRHNLETDNTLLSPNAEQRAQLQRPAIPIRSHISPSAPQPRSNSPTDTPSAWSPVQDCSAPAAARPCARGYNGSTPKKSPGWTFAKDAGAFPPETPAQTPEAAIWAWLGTSPSRLGCSRAVGRCARCTPTGGLSALASSWAYGASFSALAHAGQRGQAWGHSPDPASTRKGERVQSCLRRAPAESAVVVFVGEWTSYRQSKLGQAWARVLCVCAENKGRRVVAALEGRTGRVVFWGGQRIDGAAFVCFLCSVCAVFLGVAQVYAGVGTGWWIFILMGWGRLYRGSLWRIFGFCGTGWGWLWGGLWGGRCLCS